MELSSEPRVDNSTFNKLSEALFESAKDFRNVPLFHTESTNDLFDLYLANLPFAERQHHNCNCCKNFLRRFGDLVYLDNGVARSIFFNPGQRVDPIYDEAIDALGREVERSKVIGPIVSSEPVWGTPVTGPWTHFHYPNPAVYLGKVKKAHEIEAEKKEDFRTLSFALGQYTTDQLQAAVHLLSNDALYRSEKVLGVAKFLFELKTKYVDSRNQQTRRNLIWSAVATAPAGFCTPRSSMIGSLLDDISAGLPFPDVAAKFRAKMHPLQYQRPTSAPSLGNIEQAEVIIDKLGIRQSLVRRFARLEEMPLIWSPAIAEEQTESSGLFDHLKPRKQSIPSLEIPVRNITWDQFQATVLPFALSIEIEVLRGRNNFIGLLTAEFPESPEIFQWPGHLSHYVYHNGSMAERWSIKYGWHKVAGISRSENGRNDNQKASTVFHIPEMKDTAINELAIFPETLKAELHPIRKTIEAFSKTRFPSGALEATANGISLGDSLANTLKVTTISGTANYKIDRLI